MIEYKKIFIDGQWVEASGDGITHLVNPATEEVFAKVPMSMPEDVDKAVRAARTALPPGRGRRLPSARPISRRFARG